MKKFFTVLLCVCLTVGVAVGCGTEQAETETEETDEIKVYPEHIDAFVDTANFGEPPEIIYTTPASENGLEGELYKIEGEVTESEVTEGEEGMSIGSFTVKTDVGEVSVIDPSLLLSESGVEYGGFTDEILQKYFAVPKVGEKVCVYAEYAGYSDVLQAPACYYGGQKYVEKVVTSMLMDNGYDEDEEKAVEDTAYFQMRQRISDLLSSLTPEEQKLLTLRFGLEGCGPQSPEQVGLALGLTAAEVVAAEAKALAKLRG